MSGIANAAKCLQNAVAEARRQLRVGADQFLSSSSDFREAYNNAYLQRKLESGKRQADILKEAIGAAELQAADLATRNTEDSQAAAKVAQEVEASTTLLAGQVTSKRIANHVLPSVWSLLRRRLQDT